MSNFWTVVLIMMFFALISQVSLSLEVTSTVIVFPEVFDTSGEIGVLEGLVFIVLFAINNIGSFLQIISFQTALPAFFNIVLILPIGFGTFYLAFVMMRGGAG